MYRNLVRRRQNNGVQQTDEERFNYLFIIAREHPNLIEDIFKSSVTKLTDDNISALIGISAGNLNTLEAFFICRFSQDTPQDKTTFYNDDLKKEAKKFEEERIKRIKDMFRLFRKINAILKMPAIREQNNETLQKTKKSMQKDIAGLPQESREYLCNALSKFPNLVGAMNKSSNSANSKNENLQLGDMITEALSLRLNDQRSYSR